MKRLLTALLLLMLACGVAIPAHAQESEWEKLGAEAMSLYGQGLYDSAIVVAKKAQRATEQDLGPEHPDIAASLNNLASLYHTQGQYAQAEFLYTRSLAICEKALGPDDPRVATSLENLAELYKKTGRAKEAEALLNRAAKIRAIRR